MSKLWSAQPLPRYDAKHIRKNGIGHLADVRGNCAPGVTPIIETTRSAADKARLARWCQSQGSRGNQASQCGRVGHIYVERYFRGITTPCPELIKAHWENLLPILQDIHDIRLVEGHAFHFYEGYAGRVDCVGRFDALPESTIEFKFSERLKPINEETKLQLAAYCGALNRQYGEPYGVRIKHGLIIVATPNEVDVTLIEPEEMMEYWEKWRKRVAQFWQQTKAIA